MGDNPKKDRARALQDLLAEGSRRLVALYDDLRVLQDRCAEIIAAADLSLGPPEYERLRLRLEALEPEVNKLAGQIRIEMANLKKIRSASPQFSQSRNAPVEGVEDPSKRLELEILALDKSLLEIGEIK